MSLVVQDSLAVLILKRARELLTEESAWIRNEFAGLRNPKTGRLVDSLEAHDERANCWCLDGALVRASLDLDPKSIHALANARVLLAEELLDNPRRAICPDGTPNTEVIWSFNDRNAQHPDVLRALDRAIALAA